MFTRAGFNTHVRRRLLFAEVSVYGAGGPYRAELIRFVDSGELAWYTGGGHIQWGHQVIIWNQIGIDASHGLSFPREEIYPRQILDMPRELRRDGGDDG